MSNSSTSIKEQNKNMAFTLFRRNIRKFEQNKLAVFGLIIIVIVTGACIIGKLTGIDYATPVLPEMKNYGKRFVCQSIGRRMLFYFYRCFLFCYERNSRSGSWRIGRLLWRKN